MPDYYLYKRFAELAWLFLLLTHSCDGEDDNGPDEPVITCHVSILNKRSLLLFRQAQILLVTNLLVNIFAFHQPVFTKLLLVSHSAFNKLNLSCASNFGSLQKFWNRLTDSWLVQFLFQEVWAWVWEWHQIWNEWFLDLLATQPNNLFSPFPSV